MIDYCSVINSVTATVSSLIQLGLQVYF